MRLTIDQLEMRLRNQGVAKLEHVKSATIEPNGQLGYELKESEKPLTIREFKNLMNLYFPHLAQQLENSPPSDTGTQKDLFQEINYPKTDTPRYLQ
ncbi:YetF domain-containing protein [Priestia flexa]|uniref:YetF domain-containing protein n=1 Tax=Priestia flexa TaxID=86664 RepID=UPI0030B8831A